MELVRVAMLALVFATASSCRAIRDDQETRPLPAPEPPPERGAQPRAVERPARNEGSPRPRQRATDAERPPITAERSPHTAEPSPSEPSPANSGDTLAGPAEVTANPTPEAAPAAGDGACIERCQKTLAACVSAPSDAGKTLEDCKSAFEACTSAC